MSVSEGMLCFVIDFVWETMRLPSFLTGTSRETT